MGQYVDAHLGTFNAAEQSDKNKQAEIMNSIKEQILELNLPEIPDEILKAQAIKVAATHMVDLEITPGIPQHNITKFYDGFTIKSITDLHTEYGDYDWKYTTRPQSYNKFTTDDQAMMYLMQNGTGRITFLCIQVPQLKRGKEESTDAYYDRIVKDIKRRPKFYFEKKTYYRNEYDFDYLMRELKVITAEIKSLIDKPMEYWYMDKSSCWNPWKCDFYEACTTGVISETIYQERIVE